MSPHQPNLTHLSSIGGQSPYENNRHATSHFPEQALYSQAPQAYSRLPTSSDQSTVPRSDQSFFSGMTGALSLNTHSYQGQNHVLVNPLLVEPERPTLAQTSHSIPSVPGAIPSYYDPYSYGEIHANDINFCPRFASSPMKRTMKKTPKRSNRTGGLRKRNMLPGFQGVGQAQNESAKDYSSTTEEKARRDTKDDKLVCGPSLDDVSSYSDSSSRLVTSPHSSYSNSSLHLDRQVRPGSSSTSVGRKMSAAPLELLQNATPPQQTMLLPFYPRKLSFSSEPIQTPHKTEDCTVSTVPQGSQIQKEEKGGGRGRLLRQEDPIETGLVGVLRSLQVQPNFQEIVSTTNDWGQTLAHLSIFYDYPYLISSLVDWRIDLTIADANGLTALHYAYMKGDLDSVRSLRRGGASEAVMDKLGRTPSDLLPEGFGSVFDLDNDGKVTVGFVSGVSPLGGYSDEEVG